MMQGRRGQSEGKGNCDTRGLSDIDRLLAFIVTIVVVLALVPAAFGLAGIDVRDGSTTDDAEIDFDDGRLLVLATYGTELNDDRTSVGAVEVLVTTRGDESLDLNEVTVSWHGERTYELVPEGVDVGDASFTIDPITGDRLLQNSSDRAILRFDLGTDDVDGADRFGDRLQPGDSVRLSLTTGDGETTRTEFSTPNPLPDRPVVRFV